MDLFNESSQAVELNQKKYRVIFKSLEQRGFILRELKNKKYSGINPKDQKLFMSVGRVYLMDLSDPESIKDTKL